MIDGRLICRSTRPCSKQRVTNVLIDDSAAPQLEEVSYEMSVRRFGAIGEWQRRRKRRSMLLHLAHGPYGNAAPTQRASSGAPSCNSIEGRAIGMLFRNVLAVYLDFVEQCVTFTQSPVLQRSGVAPIGPAVWPQIPHANCGQSTVL